MADEFTLKYDGANDQLVGEDPNGNEIPIPLKSLDVSGSASTDSLDVSGSASTDSLDVSGSASIDGNVEPFAAGHDDVRVPQVRNLTVEDWESGTLDTDVYSFDTGQASVQSGVVKDGSYALRLDSLSNGSNQRLFTNGDNLSALPQLGDTVEWYQYNSTAESQSSIRFGPENNGLRFRTRMPNSSVDNKLTVNGPDDYNSISPNNSFPVAEWLRYVVKFSKDGQIEVTIYDSTGSEVLSGSVTDRLPKAGGIMFESSTSASDSVSTYWDSITVKRREPEARANTQKGVTELGNEVVPSGSIQTGPMEVPADHPNYPMVNLPVTDDLAQGEQVGYHLGINEETAVTVEAEADGNGGIQNANVSFENTQIADPANNTSADSMTADPESASEDGFIEVDIGGTTYQVPMYQS